MQGVFESWIDEPIVLRVALGGLKLSLCGKVLKEGEETLLVRPEFGPDVEISKIKILAIEEVGAPLRKSHFGLESVQLKAPAVAAKRRSVLHALSCRVLAVFEE